MTTTTAAVSRAHLAKAAVRPAMPARLMISAPSGAGKTWTALIIARQLVGPMGRIVLIDTETESALTYADEHVFEHLHWAEPYNPRDLAATIDDLASDRSLCIIVDSLTHFWTGEGGTLDIADGKFGGWKVATPAQDEMVRSIMKCKSHIIGCTREKQAYVVTETVSDGKKRQTVEKVGLAPIQREGLDYEFNVAATIDMAHTMSIGKTRCRKLSGMTFRPNHADEMADIYGEWLAGGHPVITPEQANELRARAMALPGKDEGSQIRARCLAQFKDTFGTADQVMADDLLEATALIVTYEDEAWPDGKPQPEPQGSTTNASEETDTALAPSTDATGTPPPATSSRGRRTTPATPSDSSESAQAPTDPENAEEIPPHPADLFES